MRFAGPLAERGASDVLFDRIVRGGGVVVLDD
jgi:hypothetical protein